MHQHDLPIHQAHPIAAAEVPAEIVAVEEAAAAAVAEEDNNTLLIKEIHYFTLA